MKFYFHWHHIILLYVGHFLSNIFCADYKLFSFYMVEEWMIPKSKIEDPNTFLRSNEKTSLLKTLKAIEKT